MIKKQTQLEFKISKKHVVGTMFLPIALFALFSFVAVFSESKQKDVLVLGVVFFVLLLFMGIYLWNAYTFRLTIDEEHLRMKTLFSNIKIKISNISHCTNTKHGLMIYENNKTKPSLCLTCNLEDHFIFGAWLDERFKNPAWEAMMADYEKDLEEIKNNDDFGKNNLEKEERLEQAQKTVKWLAIVGWISGILFCLDSVRLISNPYWAFVTWIVVLYPLFGIYAVFHFKGLIKLARADNKLNIYPSIDMCLFPSLIIGLYWKAGHFYLLDMESASLWAGLIAVALAVAIFVGTKELKPKKISSYLSMFAFAALIMIYSSGALLFVNEIKDVSTETIYLVEVLDRRVAKEDNKMHYYLTTNTWKEQATTEELKVPRQVYMDVREEKPIEVHLKQGYLGFKYYSIAAL